MTSSLVLLLKVVLKKARWSTYTLQFNPWLWRHCTYNVSFQRLPSAIPSTFENDGVVVLMLCIIDINRLDIKLEIISSYTGSLFFSIKNVRKLAKSFNALHVTINYTHQITSRFTFGKNFSFWESCWEIWQINLPDHAFHPGLKPWATGQFRLKTAYSSRPWRNIYLRCIEPDARYAIVVSVIWRMLRRHAFVIAWKKKKGLLLLADLKNKESKNTLPFGEFRSVRRERQ